MCPAAGGQDLVFPHHENELAQSRAAAGPCGCGSPAAHPHADSTTDAASSSGDEHAAESLPSTSGELAGLAAPPPPFVRYWVHNGFVNVDSEKMSKSLGNFFTIRDVSVQ